MVDIVTRAGKGSPLTNAEVDANFTNLAEVATVGGEPIGHEDITESSISFTAASRTFSISPVGASFTVWCKGNKHVFTSAQTVVIPNTTGLHYIYFSDAGVLSTKTTYFTWDSDAPTAYVYWNATTGAAVYFGDERHGVVLDWQTHEYLHRTRGAAIANGFAASDYTTTGDGDLDADAQLAVEGGTFFDEDMQVDIVSTATPTANTWQQDLAFPAKIPVLHLQGTAWVLDAPTNFPLKQGTARPQYNLLSGGVWSTADVTNNKYGTTWILATNNLTYPVVAIIGQSQADSQGDAEETSFSSLNLPDFPSVEFRPLYKLVYNCADSNTNTPHARIVNVIDLRSLSAANPAANPATDHGNLSGLVDDDHPQYVHISTTRTVSTAVKNSLLPTQTSNSGKYLQTDGSTASWQNVVSASDGALTLNTSGTGISGSATFSANQATASTFTVSSNATSANTASTIVARDTSGNFSAGTISAALSGNATTASNLQTGRTIAMTGDVTYTSPSFNGSQNVTAAATLANSGVTAGVYGSSTAIPSLTVDAKGRVTAASTSAISVGDGAFTVNTSTGLSGGGQLGTANQASATSITLTNTDRGSSQNIFKNIAVSGQNTIVADSNNDTLTIVGGSNVTVTTDSATDTLTIAASQPSVGNGVFTVNTGSGLTGGAQLGTANQTANTSITISHSDTSTQASVNNSNGTVIQDVTLDGFGHVTGLASVNLDDRYYTETETDGRYVLKAGDTMTGPLEFDTSGDGLSYNALENNADSNRYFVRFDLTNNASYPFLTNRTPSGDVVIKSGTAAGGAEIERVRVNGGDGIQPIEVTNATLDISSGTTQPLKLTTSSSSPWALELYRSDTSHRSRVYNNGSSWYFEHRPSFVGQTPLDSANYNDYAPTKTGGGASGTWGISITGNAATATSAGNADTTDGLHVHSGRNNEVNKIVRTDGSGYIQAGWINTTSGATTSTLDRIYASYDGYIRYVTPATFRSQIVDGYYLPLTGGTLSNGNDVTLEMRPNDAGQAYLKVGRSLNGSQGTGIIEVTQDGSHGGGFYYNGDGTPTFISGESADTITFYRMSAGTKYRVFQYGYSSNTVDFTATPTVNGTAVALSNSLSGYLPLAGGNMSGNIGRTAHHAGYFVGGHNNIGGTSTKTSPIYAIGTSYLPAESTLGNMYGVGFSHGTDASFISLSGATGWGQYVASDGDARIFLDAQNGVVVSTGSHRAPIFYDSNDTNYYVDPASGSLLRNLTVRDSTTLWGTQSWTNRFIKNYDGPMTNWQGTASGTTMWGLEFTYSAGARRAMIGYDHASSEELQIASGYGSIVFNVDYQNGHLDSPNDGTEVFRLSTYALAPTSMRSPIFYDSNDTNYYVDPSATGTSANFAGTAVAATFNATSTTNGGFQGIDADTAASPSFTWTADLNTGMYRYGADVAGISAGGNDEFRVYTSYTLSPGSSRAPIFYDSNNTAYYTNPASTSVLNALNVTTINGVAASELGGASAGGVIYENNQTITSSYTMTTNKNGMSAGPITINSGVTVTIPSGSAWTVV